MEKKFISPSDKMEYGAPELKKFYKKYLSRGLVCAVFLHVFFIFLYGISLYLEARAEKETQIRRQIELTDLLSTQDETQGEEEQIKPPEVEPQKVEALKDLAALTPEPVAKERADIETVKKVEDVEKIKAPVSSLGDENYDPTKEGQTVKVKEEVVEKKMQQEEKKEKPTKEKNYQQFEVDKAPVAVNLQSIQASMRYPEIAKNAGVEGKVTVKVLVGPDGPVVSIGGFTGPDVFKDEVTSKVMNLQFTPALQQGVPVRCWVSVPFSFKLTGKFKKEEDPEKKEEKKEQKTEEKKETKEENK